MCINMCNTGFFKRGIFFENPIPIEDNWITNEFGLDVWKSDNRVNLWIYMKMPNGHTYKMLPRLFEDEQEYIRPLLKNVLEEMKKIAIFT